MAKGQKRSNREAKKPKAADAKAKKTPSYMESSAPAGLKLTATKPAGKK